MSTLSEQPPAKKVKISREYGGSQPKQQDEARLYLKKLFDTGQLDELWSMWRQLCTNEQRSITRWKTPCPQDAEEVYFDAKGMTNHGASFTTTGQTTLDTLLPEHATRATVLENAPEPAPAPVMMQTPLAPKIFKTQAPTFKHSDAKDHKAHMAIQYAYEKDGATKTAFKYASFLTLDGMVTYGERFPVNKPQCLFEMAREGAIVAPYMDVDCTLDAPAPHLLDLIVTELVAFTQKHLGRTPRVVCTDSSRAKGEGCFKNSWHIILHDVGGFRNGATATSKGGDMRLYFEAFFKSLQALELTALDSETWDLSVYNKNSNMRCIGSHKADDESRTRMQPHEKYTGAKMSDYYVQQPGLEVIALPASMIPTVSERKASVPRARAGTSTPTDIQDDLRTYLEGEGMAIQSALTENGCKIIKVNCTCPFAGRVHKNNGQYVTITGDRAYLKCSNPATINDPGCEGQRKLLDWRPPATEPVFLGLSATNKAPSDDMQVDESAIETPQLSASIPENVRDGLIEHARKLCPDVNFGQAEVLNSAHEGERMYSVQCSGRICPKCDADGFTVKYKERTDEFSELCVSCTHSSVLGNLSAPKSTHYTLLGVSPDATMDQIKVAYRKAIRNSATIDDPAVDVSGMCDALEAAYDCLRNQSSRDEYNAKINGGGDSGGNGAIVGFREGAITLADIRQINEMLYQYLMSEQYQRYLPGYREGVELDMDTVVGKGWVQEYDPPKDDPDGKTEYEPIVTVELQTGGTDFVCPYAHCAHKHKGENLRLTYTVNGRESGPCTGCCQLKRKCSRADNTTVPVYDQCKRIVDADITTDMVQYYIAQQFNANISFMTEKGVGFATKRDSGGYDLFSTKYSSDLCDAWAKRALVGAYHNFAPLPQFGTVIPFHQMWKLLKSSNYRKEYRTVGFFPAAAPYENVPEKLRPPSDVLNTFEKFAIDENDAREYCIEHGVPADGDFDGDKLTDAGRAKLDAAVKPMTDHVLDIVCRNNETDRDYFFNYLAHTIQKPWEKPNVALVLRSDGKGAGKGAVIDPVIKILGGDEPHFHAAEVSDASSILEGNMNGVLSQKVAIILDEAYWAGSSKDKGKLRNLITCERSTIRLMYTNPFKEQSCVRLFFMSNDQQVVPYDSTCERRFKCFDLDNRYKGIANDETRAHFEPIYEIPTHVYAMWLYTRDIEGFHPRSFEVGDAELGQINSSLSPVQQWWRGCLERGYIVEEKQRKLVSTTVGSGEYQREDRRELPHTRVWDFGHWVPKQILYNDYATSQRGSHGHRLHDSAFFKELWKVVGDSMYTIREKMPSRYAGLAGRPPAVQFASLQQCRDDWQRDHGSTWERLPSEPWTVPTEGAAKWVLDEK